MIEDFGHLGHGVEVQIPLLADGDLAETALEPDIGLARIAEATIALVDGTQALGDHGQEYLMVRFIA